MGDIGDKYSWANDGTSDSVLAGDFPIKDYVVCYFDIMGQRDGLLKKVRNTQVGEMDNVQKGVNEITKHIKHFYDEWYRLVKGEVEHPDEIARFVNIPSERKEVFCNKLGVLDFGIQQLSDTTIFYADASNEFAWRAIMQMLVQLARWIIYLASNKILIRGCFAMGRGWTIMPNCLYGPIMEKAYALESKVANWPRIVIDEDVYKKFEMFKQFGNMPFIEMIQRDFDGLLFLDYLSLPAMQCYKQCCNCQILSSYLKRGYEFIESEYGKFCNESREDNAKANLAFKYGVLKMYWDHRSRLLHEAIAKGDFS